MIIKIVALLNSTEISIAANRIQIKTSSRNLEQSVRARDEKPVSNAQFKNYLV